MDSNSSHSPPRFNLLTVCTFDYFPFLLVFLQSFFKNVKSERFGRLYVVTDEIPQRFTNYLKQFESLEIISSTSQLKFDGAHQGAWRDAVDLKLKYCRKVLEITNEPLLLIDNDSLFIDDISETYNRNFDIVLTYINNPAERHVRPDGLKINFIASAVAFINPEKSIAFIEKWLACLTLVKANFRPPHETPALNLTIEDLIKNGNFNLGTIHDSVISSDQKALSNTKVIHLKTWGATKGSAISNFQARISKNEWPAHQTPANYLDALVYEDWLKYQLAYVK